MRPITGQRENTAPTSLKTLWYKTAKSSCGGPRPLKQWSDNGALPVNPAIVLPKLHLRSSAAALPAQHSTAQHDTVRHHARAEDSPVAPHCKVTEGWADSLGGIYSCNYGTRRVRQLLYILNATFLKLYWLRTFF